MMFKDRQNPQGGIRFLILFVHVMAGVLTAGVIVGWGQLAPILTEAGVYQNHCLANQTSCGAQQSLLGNMFNYGATISIFVQSPSGVFIDFIGPRLTALFGLALFLPGCLMFAFSTAHLNMYLVGFLCISAGGPFVFVSIMSTANLFPSNKGVVLMLMNGSYGGGALVFLLFNWLFTHYHYSIKTLFIAYAILSGLITIVVAITWPLKKYTSTEDEILNQSQYPLTKWQMFKRDAFSIQYLFLVLFTGIMVLKSNFYLGNSDTILAMISDDADLVDLYSKIFGLMLPIIGFIVGPIGLVIDKMGLNAGAFFLLFLSALASITGMIHNMKLQIVTFIAFSMYFPYIYGFWATFLIMKFGFENYGVLYAGVAVMAGIMNLAGTPLANLANEGDIEHHMFKINLGLLIGSSAFIIYPIVSVIYNASRKSKDEAHQRLLSNIQTRNVEY